MKGEKSAGILLTYVRKWEDFQNYYYAKSTEKDVRQGATLYDFPFKVFKLSNEKKLGFTPVSQHVWFN